MRDRIKMTEDKENSVSVFEEITEGMDSEWEEYTNN